MESIRKGTQSKTQQYNVNRNNQGRSCISNNQTGQRPLFSALFSQKQCNDQSSCKTKILKPPVPKSPVFKGYSKVQSSQSSIQTKKIETVEQKKNRLMSHLCKFECPFNWKPRQVNPVNEPETIIKRMQEKDREVKDERKFKWNSFIFHLVISYELWRAKKLSQAFEEVCGLESLLRIQSNRGDFMFNCIEDALWHVVIVSKAFLYLEKDMVTQAEQLVERILPMNMMKRSHQAGIHGIKAAMFMEYGHKGNKNALQEAMEAVKIDRTIAEWHYYCSKCMGRIRRVAECHELVHPEEVRAINQALKLEQQNASYKVLLGQVLSERSFREYKKHYPDKKSEQYKKIWKTSSAAMHYFKDAAELSPSSPHILMRCARGMMKLPPGLQDLKFTKECIAKALELAPNNPMVYHLKGMYHERYDCEAELPLEAYEKAASLDNFGAHMDQIRLHHKLKIGDIVEELDELAVKFEQVDRLQVIYTQAGSYLLFIKKDIIGALKYYLKVIEINSNSYAMMSHKPIFFHLRDPINMFDVMLEELATKTEKNTFTFEERQVMKAFIVKAREHQPLPSEKKKRLTVEEILDLSRERVEDMYRQSKSVKKNRKKKNKACKKWRGKKKEGKQETKIKSNDREKLYPGMKIIKHKTENNNAYDQDKRRGSVSSVSTVDSDYHRDSTVYGPRGFFLHASNESLCSTNKEIIQEQGYSSLHLTRKFCVPEKRNVHSRASRDSSISSMSSSGGIVEDSNFGYHSANLIKDSQLTIENMKKHDMEKSYGNVRRLSMLSLSNSSSESLASSANTLSVMDRVKQSYAMLGRNSESTRGKKKNFGNYGSTQSLNTQVTTNLKNNLGSKYTDRSGSSQSLNALEQNLDNKFATSFKSGKSFCGSSRSFTFMPEFACKNSQSDLE